jgi:hypothetical protein
MKLLKEKQMQMAFTSYTNLPDFCCLSNGYRKLVPTHQWKVSAEGSEEKDARKEH